MASASCRACSGRPNIAYADYGNERVRIFTAAGSAPTRFQIDSEKFVHTVRSELVWRFNFGGPVVARY